MDVRFATASDLPSMAQLAASLQGRPERHIPYLSDDAASITAEITELPTWESVSAVAVSGGEIIGWLVGEIDLEIGRVWWLGPFVNVSEWAAVAGALLAHAEAALPTEVTQQEFAIDAAFIELAEWSAQHGFHADPGSVALALDGPIEASPIATREIRADDVEFVAPLHDRLFPNTHYTGRQIVESDDDRHVRLVAEIDGAVVGYVAVEHQADDSGYVDFLGVDDAHRGAGIGGGLVAAGAAVLRERGCGRIHLTVREAHAGARALYARLGFVEELLLVPLRKGFTLP